MPESEDAAAAFLERFFQRPPVIYSDLLKGRTRVSVYLEKIGRETAASLRRGLREMGLKTQKITVSKLPRENWAESWKRHFKPLKISPSLLIKPSWSRRRARPGQRVVVLDPGLSFGTGQHATTLFCLKRLAACRRVGTAQSFLDIGTGSGILAIAAAKLGYSPVEAFDFDPESIRVSRSNAVKNRVQHRVRPQLKDLTGLPLKSQRRYDVICANLIDDLLISQAEKIYNRLKPGGQLIVAGILRKQFPAVKKVFVTFCLKFVTELSQKEWQSGQFAMCSRCDALGNAEHNIS